jgi:pyrroline-5-carboxylate reductase
MSDRTIGFIGAGQMARALSRGFVARGLMPPARIVAFDPDTNAKSQFAAEISEAKWADSNQALVQQSDIVVLAVKPQSFPQVCAELESALRSTQKRDKLFISILAGVPLADLTQGLRTPRVVRAMSNTPCLVSLAATAYTLGEGVTPQDAEFVQQLFSAVGLAFSLPEKQLDAVTGLSGSGPAYVYMLIEALSDGGVRMGLPRTVATSLAAQTVLGAAQMVLTTGEHPGTLKDRVASPAGTTIAGLQVLERRAVRAALIDAVEAATLRSRELGSKG